MVSVQKTTGTPRGHSRRTGSRPIVNGGHCWAGPYAKGAFNKKSSPRRWAGPSINGPCARPILQTSLTQSKVPSAKQISFSQRRPPRHGLPRPIHHRRVGGRGFYRGSVAVHAPFYFYSAKCLSCTSTVQTAPFAPYKGCKRTPSLCHNDPLCTPIYQPAPLAPLEAASTQPAAAESSLLRGRRRAIAGGGGRRIDGAPVHDVSKRHGAVLPPLVQLQEYHRVGSRQQDGARNIQRLLGALLSCAPRQRSK